VAALFGQKFIYDQRFLYFGNTGTIPWKAHAALYLVF